MTRGLLMLFVALQADCLGQASFASRLSEAALSLTRDQVRYDPTYYTIPYPNGDVPPDRGVCTDVIVRAYRKLGIDLQKEVHDDMKSNFDDYPNNWGLKRTDRNIDHRRVPNLMTFFKRHGIVKAISNNPLDYHPGDIVSWDLGRNTPHIGILIDQKSGDNTRHLVVHNIGNGQEVSDCLFKFKIIGHYTYTGN